jgi:hypothetical protein
MHAITCSGRDNHAAAHPVIATTEDKTMTDTTETDVRLDPPSRQYERLADEANAHNKGIIFDALAEARVQTLTVSFDGYADSGQIESIDAFDGANNKIPLPGNRQVRLMSPEWDDLRLHGEDASLREAIEMLVYEYLEATHMGWEDGEGAYGSFVFTVPDRTITLEHNERFVDVETHTHTF